MKYSILYSNHGEIPVHIEDITLLVKSSIETVPGNTVFLSDKIIPDACNIIIESFEDYSIIQELLEIQADYIIIATEFITGNTFNAFSGSLDYGKKRNWKIRYNGFVLAAKYARAIWCLSDDIVPNYKELVGSKVFNFPMTYIPELKQVNNRKASEKDIDILFTGSMTSYRKQIFNQLSNSGLKIAVHPATTLSFVRSHLCSRAKIAINIRQSSDWKYPSLMRYHYHIINNIPLISEKCDVCSYLDKFVIHANASELVDKCRQLIDNYDNNEIWEKYKKFAEEMPPSKFIPKLLNDTMSLPSSKKMSILIEDLRMAKYNVFISQKKLLIKNFIKSIARSILTR